MLFRSAGPAQIFAGWVSVGAGVAELLQDFRVRFVENMGLVLCSEFGRGPKINSRNGRDHHPKVFSTLLAGGPIKGGTIYGASDKSGSTVADKQTTIQDFHSTVGHALGLKVDEIVMSPSNRPFTVGDKGKVIAEVLAS